MPTPKPFVCRTCGEYKRHGQDWFLVLEDAWLDRLKVLHWNDRLATEPRVHCLCSAAHVRELVAHWMATGSLSYPFVSLLSHGNEVKISKPSQDVEANKAVEIPCEALIGELAVHRESLQRALSEQPECLSTILNALLSALERSPAGAGEPKQRENAMAVV